MPSRQNTYFLTLGNCETYSKGNITPLLFSPKEGINIIGHLICTNWKLSLIPAGALEVPLLLTFPVKSERIFELMKSFVNYFYECDDTGK